MAPTNSSILIFVLQFFDGLQVSSVAWTFTTFCDCIFSSSHPDARRAGHAKFSLFFCLCQITISFLIRRAPLVMKDNSKKRPRLQ